jgi:hypothetical protein
MSFPHYARRVVILFAQVQRRAIVCGQSHFAAIHVSIACTKMHNMLEILILLYILNAG